MLHVWITEHKYDSNQGYDYIAILFSLKVWIQKVRNLMKLIYLIDISTQLKIQI